MTAEEDAQLAVLLTRTKIVIRHFSKIGKEMNLPLPILLEDALRVYLDAVKCEVALQHIQRGDMFFQIPEGVYVHLSNRTGLSAVENWLAADPEFKPKTISAPEAKTVTAPQAH